MKFDDGDSGGLIDYYHGQGHRFNSKTGNYRENDPRDFGSEERELYLKSRASAARTRAESPRAQGTSRFIKGLRVSGQNGIPGIADGYVGRPASSASSNSVNMAQFGGPVRPAVPSRNSRKPNGGQPLIRASTDLADDPVRRGKNELLNIARNDEPRQLIKAMQFVKGELTEIALLKKSALRWALMPGPKRDDFFLGKDKELELALATRKSLIEQVIKIIINDGKDSIRARRFTGAFEVIQDLLPKVFKVAVEALADCKIINQAIKDTYEAKYNLDILEMAAELSKTEVNKSVGTSTHDPLPVSETPAKTEINKSVATSTNDTQPVTNPPRPARSPVSSSPPTPPDLTPDISVAPSPAMAPSQPAIGKLTMICGDNVLVGPVNSDIDISVEIKARSNDTTAADQAFIQILMNPAELVNALAALCPISVNDYSIDKAAETVGVQEDSDEEL